MLELISEPWHWSISGFAIAMVMFVLLYAGKEFGVSGNLRTMCSIAGAGKNVEFFRFDWKAQRWNLLFIGGAVIGGFLATELFPTSSPAEVSAETVSYLNSIGIDGPSAKSDFVPAELFATEKIFSVGGVLFALFGGLLVGFGTRWAGGCTSGHAISGLSNLQLPSLIAVIGFFIGGLLMSWFILPFIIQL
jgi:uncharacterized membrane protein YedE/YeeE